MSVVPDELAAAVRDAATATKPHGADLGSVHRRARQRRRRRTGAAAACAAVLVGLSAGAVPALMNDHAAQDAAGAEPAQRLLLDPTGLGVVQIGDGPQFGIAHRDGANEVLPDGSLVNHPLPGLGSWQEAIGLPDGRLVVLGTLDREPQTRGLPIGLEVLRPDGTVELARDLRVGAEPVDLVAATDRTAYLIRTNGLVAHDLASGRERLVLPLAPAGREMVKTPIDVGAERIAVQVEPCTVRVVDLANGRQRAERTLACDHIDRVRLSPNGRMVAVSYTSDDAHRLALLDTATGAVRVDHVLRAANPVQAKVAGSIYGIAWSDATTVLVAWAELPENPDRIYELDEVLRTIQVRVQ